MADFISYFLIFEIFKSQQVRVPRCCKVSARGLRQGQDNSRETEYVIKVIVVLYTTYNCCFNASRSYSRMLEVGEAQMCFTVFSRCLVFYNSRWEQTLR